MKRPERHSSQAACRAQPAKPALSAALWPGSIDDAAAYRQGRYRGTPTGRPKSNKICGCGGIGRLGGFRFLCVSVQVRVLSPAPKRRAPFGVLFFGMEAGLEPTFMRQSGGLPLDSGSTESTPLFSPPPGEKMQIESCRPHQKRAPFGVLFFGMEAGLEPTFMRPGGSNPVKSYREMKFGLDSGNIVCYT